MVDVSIAVHTKQLRLKREMYSLEVIFKASYLFLDRLYFLFDEDKESDNKDILVNITSKTNISASDFEEMISEFHNELVNYSVYLSEVINSVPLRTILLSKFLGIEQKNDASQNELNSGGSGSLHTDFQVDDTYDSITGLDKNEDPLEISKLWEESERMSDDDIINDSDEDSLEISKLWDESEKMIDDNDDLWVEEDGNSEFDETK